MLKLVPYRRNEFDKSFEEMFHMMDDFFKTPVRHSLKLDIVDEETQYVLEADIPGFTKEEITLEFEQDVMMIKLEKNESEEEEKKNYIRKERHSMRMERALKFKNVNFEGVEAKLDHGVLRITIPKVQEETTRKRIEIQ